MESLRLGQPGLESPRRPLRLEPLRLALPQMALLVTPRDRAVFQYFRACSLKSRRCFLRVRSFRSVFMDRTSLSGIRI